MNYNSSGSVLATLGIPVFHNPCRVYKQNPHYITSTALANRIARHAFNIGHSLAEAPLVESTLGLAVLSEVDDVSPEETSFDDDVAPPDDPPVAEVSSSLADEADAPATDDLDVEADEPLEVSSSDVLVEADAVEPEVESPPESDSDAVAPATAVSEPEAEFCVLELALPLLEVAAADVLEALEALSAAAVALAEDEDEDVGPSAQ